jgi:hypothetical protein
VTDGAGSRAADRVERFRAWLEALAEAMETADLAALDRLFALEASYRPGPFEPVLRGRHAIRAHFGAQLAERGTVAVSARALGVGTTYGVAHWVVGWSAGGRDRMDDGVLLAAFDPLGRCTSLRSWSAVGEGKAPSAPETP